MPPTNLTFRVSNLPKLLLFCLALLPRADSLESFAAALSLRQFTLLCFWKGHISGNKLFF